MRIPSRWLVIGVVAVVLGGTAFTSPPSPSPQKVSLRELEDTPDNYLGHRIVVEAQLTENVKALGPVAELTVFADSNQRPTRLRFLAPKSLADQVARIGGGKSVVLLGTVSAPESARVGHAIEVEEITLRNADGPATVLKPTATAPPPTSTTPAKAEVPAATTKPPAVETGKKSDKVPTLLVFVAGGMVVFLIVAMVVGFSLIRRMKSKAAAAVKRLKISDSAGKRPR